MAFAVSATYVAGGTALVSRVSPEMLCLLCPTRCAHVSFCSHSVEFGRSS